MHIQDVELRTGLDRATIRYYEKEALVIPKRQENGYRVYCDTDVQLLLRVKLLRQLGISLSTIKTLQQGSGTFSGVLEEQVHFLENQIHQNLKAINVCQAMRAADVQYGSLDASYYLKMLNSTTGKITQEYREPISKEIHPIRRFAARILDVTLLHALIQFVMVVLLRVRPWNDAKAIFVRYLSYLIWIPLEAVFIHFWGTTPGKWVLGIRFEAANGGKMHYGAAVFRAFSAAFAGCGLYVPFVEIWRFIKSYQTLKRGESLPWDEETEVIYTNWATVKKVSGIILALVCAILLVSAGGDTVLPPNRGEALTVEEFSENFNFYQSVIEIQDNYKLESNGSWGESADESGIITITLDAEHVRAPFRYEYSNNKISSIHYKDLWTNVAFMDTMPNYCVCAMYAVLGSRPGINYKELIEAGEQFTENFHMQFEAGNLLNAYSGNFQFDDILVTWNIKMENIEFIHNGLLYEAEGTTGTYTLEYSIDICH